MLRHAGESIGSIAREVGRRRKMASHTADFATLQIRRTFAAPREKVFRAWTELEALDRWMCRDVPTHEVKYLELSRLCNASNPANVCRAARKSVPRVDGTRSARPLDVSRRTDA